MESFSFWLDRPFDPRRVSGPNRPRARFVIIRCRGSLGRSAVRALIILALLAIV